MRVKNDLFRLVLFDIGYGQTVRFQKDTWLWETPLALHHPHLYNVIQRKEVFIASILGQVVLNFIFHNDGLPIANSFEKYKFMFKTAFLCGTLIGE